MNVNNENENVEQKIFPTPAMTCKWQQSDLHAMQCNSSDLQNGFQESN